MNKKACVSIITIVLVVVALAIPRFAYANESNNGLTTAQIGTTELNNSKENAEEMKIGYGDITRGYRTIISTETNNLWYKFSVDSSDNYIFKATTSAEKVKFDITDSNGKAVKTFYGTTGGSEVKIALKKSVVYYMNANIIVSDSEYHKTDFTLETGSVVNILSKVVVNGTTSITKNSATVKWAKQSCATKYQIRYKVAKGKYITKTTTKNNIKLTKLSKNKKYYFNVRAYCKGAYTDGGTKKSDWSSWSTTKTFKTKAK